MLNKKECIKDNDNNLILKNIDEFNKLHNRKGYKLSNWNKYIDTIVIPTTINICVNSSKYKIDFIRYSKYIIDTLNDGFSGKIHSPYKNINKNDDFEYNQENIKKMLDIQKINNSQKNAEIIYNYINTKTDTKIRFYLHSIVYHDNFIEEKFEKNNTIKFVETIYKNGFRILESHHRHLNINIIKFNCLTLGVSIFPWMRYVIKKTQDEKIFSYMQVFLDFCTIHPDIADNKFNNCKTLIHEVGHIFGLRHSFSCNTETLQIYSILLGKIFIQKEILDKINLTNNDDIKKTKKTKEKNSDSSEKKIVTEPIDKNDLVFLFDKLVNKNNDVQLYPDIPIQPIPTNYDPFKIGKFPFYNDIPSDFACFMDYSPDSVLTHFTESQCKIMHYMIRIFKPYLIKNSKSELENLNNNRVRLYINKKNNTKNTNHILSMLLENSSIQKYYVVYDNKNSFKYTISEIDENIKSFIYREK